MCVVKDDDGRQASQGKTKKGATRDAGKDEGANETTEWKYDIEEAIKNKLK